MPSESSRYRLVFRGKFIPGLEPAEVAANLARLFNVSSERVSQLLATIPAVIKQDVDLDAGNRYLEALAEAGLITHLEALGTVQEPVADAGWDGIERRIGPRRLKNRDRRDARRSTSIQPDRRSRGGRRKTD